MPLLARRRLSLLLLGLAAAGGSSPGVALAAEAWPTRPVRVVVPAPAGSSLDLIARLLGDKLKDRWGQPVVVENKAGAGGMLGTDVAAKAAPDGHTLVLSFNGPVAFAPHLYAKVPYDPARDLVPVVMTTSQPNVLAVSAALPVKTLAEFIGWARAKPGGLNFSSLGMGSSAHLTMEMFLAEIGAKGTHIPFNGSPPAAMAVAQGEADASFMTAPALMAHVRSGKVRLLAVSSTQHPESLKDLPSLASAGVKVESLAWNGLFTAAGTPEAVVARLNADVNTVLADPAVRAQMEQQGLTPVGGTAADFRKVVDADGARWGALIRRLGLKLD
ncbi:Bug family tripartite tricarboxylate transporter substrate binding protein [Ideonella livida]|uniref:Tripartite tricarboxylate transporter substrate binding protein n=1 Tax=Ideonella livida TaxID=2707176 RepID=A0A7C9PKN2_9BURK|nr:tripartite tricarboxylate transporter substrate binding protein [Ideonella livida]NDY93492.1 tripartite tricarboxylate transporter substrate binding protein [Ideonella livida]